MLTDISPLDLNPVDLIALAWFFTCWFGYAFYAEKRAATKPCLSNVLHRHRVRWMEQMIARENRVADASLLANLERNVSFFASSTLIILAGVMTALGAVDKFQGATNDIPWMVHTSKQVLQLKLVILGGIFIYAFFKFTWSLRQYGFACVIVGSAPFKNGDTDKSLPEHAAHVISRAAHAFNLGLRSYYFALSYLVWFVHPWLFILLSAWVVAVLFRREFKSRVLRAMKKS